MLGFSHSDQSQIAQAVGQFDGGLRAYLPRVKGRLRENVDLAPLTWFGVGGRAEYLFKPENEEDLAHFLAHCPVEIPVHIIGVASNLLVRDGGVPGVVIRLGREFTTISHENDQLTVGAACLDLNVAKYAALHGLGGLSFLSGIPGTIGGALYMNAGAYGSEIKDVLIEAHAIDRGGRKHILLLKDMAFSYRHSMAHERKNKEALFFTKAIFKVKTNIETSVIEAQISDISKQRQESQPSSKTGGSTFRNPEGEKAWQLIDQAGLRGYRVGGAHMSNLHCNFIVNDENATAQDIEELGEYVRNKVKEKTGHDLIWEIKTLGIYKQEKEDQMTQNNAKTIAVLLGGWSREREVSLTSGKIISEKLENMGYQVRRVDVSQDLDRLKQQLTPKPDVAFIALHGTGGEDGTIQAILELLQIPYTHSSVSASAVGMNKVLCRYIAESLGIQVAQGKTVSTASLLKQHPLPVPYVIKPIAEGSTVGVCIITKQDQHLPADMVDVIGPEALVETFIPGKELTVALMGGKALTVTDIQFKTEIFDYQAKYSDGYAKHVLPAEIPQDVFDKCLSDAEKIYQAIGCNGISRVDYRYDPSKSGTQGLYFLEINTHPGFTPISLAPEQAQYKGCSFEQLLQYLIDHPIRPSGSDHQDQSEKKIA